MSFTGDDLAESDGTRPMQRKMNTQNAQWLHTSPSRMDRMRRLRSMFLVLTLTAMPHRILGQEAESSKPLPELQGFLKEVRVRLASDSLLLSQYTYTQKVTERRLDKNGRITTSEEQVFEVYPSFEKGMTYLRLISKNGKPRSDREIEKSDREYDKKRAEWEKKLEREGTDARARRLAKEAEGKRKEAQILDEAMEMYRFAMSGREMLDEQPAVLLTFEPRSEYKPRSREAKYLSRIAGRAWICEEDYELMRLEARLQGNISIGFGLLARLNKGATATFQRRKINGEIWLPVQARFQGTGRLLLLKNMRLDTTVECTDFLKFSVDTRVQFHKVGK